MTEKELILAAQKGSQIAYEELIHLRQKIIYYFVFFLCGNDEAADGITRGVFVTAWNQISYLERMNRSFTALLCSLASLECESYVKHQKRRVSGVIRMGDDTVTAPQIDLFLERLSAVPFHRRRILLLVDMCSLSIVEAAEILSSTADEITAELEAARSACGASFAEIMPRLPEPPKSFAHEIIDDIQHSSGKSENKGAAAAAEYRPSRRFVFGRFSIIAACVALLLLAYSGGFLGHKGPAVASPGGGSSQSSSSSGSHSDSAPAATETTATAGSGTASETGSETATMPEDTAPTGDSSLVPGDKTTAPDGGAAEGGGSSSSQSYIPSGEKYSAVYLSGTSAATTLSQFCAGSFRAALPDGSVAIYYMIPNSNIDTAIAALESAGITYAVYDAGSSIDSGADSVLFILFD